MLLLVLYKLYHCWSIVVPLTTKEIVNKLINSSLKCVYL